MNIVNTPSLETERLILRKFTGDDLSALFLIYSDKDTNTFLPWFPLNTMEEARHLYEKKYKKAYRQDSAYMYAVCLKSDNVPIGYVHAETDESRDFGYGLRSEFWHQGIISEASRAVLEQLRRDGVPYITATHDVNNPRSGNVMRQLGMSYKYSYEEQWQPKDLPVIFRMYQLNLDGNNDRVFRKYWNISAVRFVETEL